MIFLLIDCVQKWPQTPFDFNEPTLQLQTVVQTFLEQLWLAKTKLVLTVASKSTVMIFLKFPQTLKWKNLKVLEQSTRDHSELRRSCLKSIQFLETLLSFGHVSKPVYS